MQQNQSFKGAMRVQILKVTLDGYFDSSWLITTRMAGKFAGYILATFRGCSLSQSVIEKLQSSQATCDKGKNRALCADTQTSGYGKDITCLWQRSVVVCVNELVLSYFASYLVNYF